MQIVSKQAKLLLLLIKFHRTKQIVPNRINLYQVSNKRRPFSPFKY